MWGALSACIQYADIYWKHTRVQSDGLNIHSTAMSSDGNYWVTANCFMV
jgi:hypothetical protein